MKVYSYLLKTLTNLHAGSGESSFGVIDNQVQRDAATGLPTIHASSLKGSLREFCREHLTDDVTSDIFGADTKKGEDTKAGKCKFLSADILSRPVRSDKASYFHATDPGVVGRYLQKCEDLSVASGNDIKEWYSVLDPADAKPRVFEEQYDKAIAEETDWKATCHSHPVNDRVKEIWGERPLVMTPENFKQLDLPVIARNSLNNGISENLWYEEVVPADARFSFFIVGPEALMDRLNEAMTKELVQVGANASVGYGLCKITCLNDQ